MATTGDAPLNLTKPEASDVVSLPVINTNYDTINTHAASVDSTLTSHTASIGTLNTAVGAGGSVVKATNIAGGALGRIPIQSAANTTIFVSAATGGGKLLYSSPSSPYATWNDPMPFKIASGVISSGWSAGAVSVDLTSYGFTVAPTVSLTPLSSNLSLITSVTLNSAPSTTGFTVNARTYNGTAFANGSPTTHWVAIQLLPAP
jgi:hypothetical protein